MTDLHKFFVNPFDDPNIGVDVLLAFATDHFQRLSANNAGGVYAARLAATNTAITGVNSAFADDLTKLAARKSLKAAKDRFRKGLPAAVAKLQGAVVAKFGAKSVEELRCFPRGRNAFRSCTDDQLANELQVLVNGVSGLQAQLGAAVAADAAALLTGWGAVYTGSESASGAKSTTEAAKRAARMALQLELFRNLLTLAMAFPRQPEVMDTFMQQSLLEPTKSAPEKPAPAPEPGK